MAGECQGNDADGGADRGGGGADENGELAYARGRAEGAHAAGQPVHEPGAGKGLQRIARTNDKRDPSGGGDIGGDGPRQHCRPDPKAPDESEPQGEAGGRPDRRGAGIDRGELQAERGGEPIGRGDSDQFGDEAQADRRARTRTGGKFRSSADNLGHASPSHDSKSSRQVLAPRSRRRMTHGREGDWAVRPTRSTAP